MAGGQGHASVRVRSHRPAGADAVGLQQAPRCAQPLLLGPSGLAVMAVAAGLGGVVRL